MFVTRRVACDGRGVVTSIAPHSAWRSRRRWVWSAALSWVFTVLLVVDLGATPHANATSALQRFGALQSDGAPGVVSHRGAKHLAPENTLPAITAALNAGAEFVEIDLRRTRDDQIVLIHDPTVDRTTNGAGRVSEFSFAQLRSMDAGSWFAPQFAGVKVPAFAEAMAVLEPAPVSVLIELKDDWTPAQLAPVLRHLREKQMTHRVVLLSFNLATMQSLQQSASDFARMLLTRELGTDTIDLAVELGVSAVGAKAALYAAFPDAIAAIHARGLGAAVYTLNQAAEWQFAAVQELDLVITDDPAAFTAWRQQHATDVP